MADFKYHEVWTSSGKSTMRTRKGQTGSPQFWAKVHAAEAEGLRYCGSCHLALDAGEMVAKFQCRSCYQDRMIDFTNYRPPKVRQSMESIRPREERQPTGRYRDDPEAHRRAWEQYRAENEAREARRVEAARLWDELSRLDSPEPATTPVEVKPDFSLYDERTAARLAALQQQLRDGIE